MKRYETDPNFTKLLREVLGELRDPGSALLREFPELGSLLEQLRGELKELGRS
jgi:hypothetical protein